MGRAAREIKGTVAASAAARYNYYMTDVRRLWPFAAVILLALTAEHALGLGTKALAFVHEGWLAAFLDSALIRAFCL